MKRAIAIPPAAAALAATVAYLAAAPLTPLAGSAHDVARLLQLALLAVTTLLALLGRRNREEALPLWFKFGAFGCLALAAASTFAAPHRLAAAQEVALMLGLVSLTSQAYLAARTGDVAWVYGGLLAGSGFYLLLVTGVYAAVLVSGALLDARLLHVGFDNPRFFNHVQTLTIPIMLGWSVAARSRLQRHAALAVTSLHFAWMFMDLARASLLALAVATTWLIWMGAAPLWRRLILCSAVGAAIHATLFVALPQLLGQNWVGEFATAQELGSSHSRDLLLSAALELIRAHPGLGAGPMHFAALMHSKGAHPHNLYLQWAAEFGLPSLSLLLLLLIWPLWRVSMVLRKARADSQPMTSALGAAMLAALTDAVFSGNFVMPVSQVWIALIYGLLLAALPSAQGTPRPVSRQRYFMLAMLLASQVWLCAQAWRQWHYDPPRMAASSPVTAAEQKPRPRFWRYGWL